MRSSQASILCAILPVFIFVSSGSLGLQLPDNTRDGLPEALPILPDDLPHWPDDWPKWPADLPTIQPGFFDITVSTKCAEGLTRMFADNRTEETARAIDACGKVQPGFLVGNLAWLGHYPECKRLEEYRYCHVSLKLNITALDPYLRLGLCLPRDCDESDVANSMEDIIDGLDFEVLKSVNPVVWRVYCAKYPPRPYDTGFYATVILCCVAAILIISGAFLEIHLKRKRQTENGDVTRSETLPLLHHSNKQNGGTKSTSGDANHRKDLQNGKLCRVLLCFSFTRNLKETLKTETKEGNMLCLNGIRVISMFWIILGHTILFLYTMKGFTWDGIFSLDFIGTFAAQALVNAFPAVDTFFFLSGLLLVYISLGRMSRSGGKISWPLFYFHRYWRLLPTLGFAMLFTMYIFPYLGEGPLWGSYATFDHNCHKYWWGNLLYINNFYPEKVQNGCIYWTWYLANDMQFYVISPVILIALYRKPKVGFTIIGVLTVASLATTMALVIAYDLSAVLMGLFNTSPADAQIMSVVYVKPYCRILPYLIGMTLGYGFHKWRGKRIRMNKIIVVCGWAASIATGIAVVYGLYGEFHGRPLSTLENAIYLAFSRLGWACALAWLVFACFYGYGGWVNDFLSWRAWLPLCRITYAAYLFHPLVLEILTGNTSHAFSLNSVYFSYYFVGSCVFSYLIALLVTLAFELPLANLEGLFLK